jgi:2-oxoglutarate ferredoxin oxidoreductase subunit beta
MVTMSDYAGLQPAWCPGCGNFGILKAVNQALVALEIEPHRVLMVSGIGQAGKLPHYSRGNVFNSLHGRPVPPAVGAKIVNPDLVVIAFSGDGDAYGEGGNHFIHAVRRNNDITYLVHNNQVYGLTKGQASPTSDVGFVTKTTPEGASNPVNPIALAIVSGAGFVARGFAGDSGHLAGIIRQGILHRGFSLIDVLQPCVSFNHRNTYQWYRQRVYKLEEEKGYDPADRKAALEKAFEWGEKIPIGIIYTSELPVYEDTLPALREGALLSREISPGRAAKLIAEFL